MRVAFVDQCGDKPGGAEESLALLLEHLPHGIEPIVVLYERGDFEERLRLRGVRTLVVPIGEAVRAAVRERIPVRSALGTPAAVRALARAFRAERIDLVHTNSMKAHLIAAPAARLRGIPCVMHLRDMVDGFGRVALRAVSLSCVRERIAISRAVASWYALPRTTVIPNPVDLGSYSAIPDRRTARRALGIPDDGLPLIGIVGRINRWKGQDAFLRIAAAARRTRALRCAVVGEARFRDADFVPELHALAESLGIAAVTHFLPWSDDPRLVYAALDAHCNCSTREPFGRTIVEAAAAGVPTVAYDDGGAVDVVTDGVDGRIVPAGDEAAFAAAVAGVLSEPGARDRLGKAARAASLRFEATSHARLVRDVLLRAAA